MTPTVDQILDFLSKNRVRATYGAVGKLLGVPPRSVGKELGPRCPRASWVVSSATGRPTDYPADKLDPALTPSTEVIHTAEELLRRMGTVP